jgi:hypothetical protein
MIKGKIVCANPERSIENKEKDVTSVKAAFKLNELLYFILGIKCVCLLYSLKNHQQAIKFKLKEL